MASPKWDRRTQSVRKRNGTAARKRCPYQYRQHASHSRPRLQPALWRRQASTVNTPEGERRVVSPNMVCAPKKRLCRPKALPLAIPPACKSQPATLFSLRSGGARPAPSMPQRAKGAWYRRTWSAHRRNGTAVGNRCPYQDRRYANHDPPRCSACALAAAGKHHQCPKGRKVRAISCCIP